MNVVTPIVKCNVGIENVNVYIKRDDLLPFSFGGNKVRIAEEYYLDMLNNHRNCMIGYGNSRSNLCRVLSNICSVNNKICYIVSPSDDDGVIVDTCNSRLVKSCDAILKTCSKKEVAKTIEEVIEECEDKGLLPYYINGDKYGRGNEAVPVNAYVKVYEEIKRQSIEMGIEFDYIFLATGTGMTQAGLVAGCKMAGGKEKIVGVSVAREKEVAEEIIKNYINAYANKKDIKISIDDSIHVLDDYLCGGYGKYDERILRVIHEMYYCNGISLDYTYTGKAFWGVLNYMQKKEMENKNILFIHTGGTPLFFDLLNAGKLNKDIVMLQNDDENCK